MILFDPLYFLFVGPFMLIAMYASARVKSTFKRFSRVGVRSGMTGAEAAAAVARSAGIAVRIEQSSGFLSDHYDPRGRVLRLSPDVYAGRSISAVAVAAHEAGHAIQDARAYAPLKLRSFMVPITQFGSTGWIWIFLAGMLLSFKPLVTLGILVFGVTVVFQLVTLPVEFDASRRARLVLAETGIVTSAEEEQGVGKVLNAAAMTYVASALTSIATLLYLIMRSRD
jgi:Zn-dependent membrane protease YugP